MFMSLIKYLFVSILMVACVAAQAVIYDVVRLKNRQTGREIYLMKDFHKGWGCGSQQQDIINNAKKMNAHVIVEDMLLNFGSISGKAMNTSAFFSDNSRILKGFSRNPLYFDANENYHTAVIHSETPLLGMTHACQSENVKVTNVECRFLINLCQNAIWQKGLLEETLGAVTGERIYEVTMVCRDKVKLYNDGEIFNRYYRDTYAELSRNSCLLASLNSSKSVNVYEMLMKDGFVMMIDCNILHAIAGTPTIQPIFVVAGGAHINNILPILWHSGYDVVSSDTVSALSDKLSIFDPSWVNNPDNIFNPVNINDYFNGVEKMLEFRFHESVERLRLEEENFRRIKKYVLKALRAYRRNVQAKLLSKIEPLD